MTHADFKLYWIGICFGAFAGSILTTLSTLVLVVALPILYLWVELIRVKL